MTIDGLIEKLWETGPQTAPQLAKKLNCSLEEVIQALSRLNRSGGDRSADDENGFPLWESVK
jgi:hypothetical protein